MTKPQWPTNDQDPMTKEEGAATSALGLGHWSFVGHWGLAIEPSKTPFVQWLNMNSWLFKSAQNRSSYTARRSFSGVSSIIFLMLAISSSVGLRTKVRA